MFSLRNMLCATAFALTTAAAGQASAATEVYINSVTLGNDAKVAITSPSLNETTYSDAISLIANFGIGPSADTFQVWAFCIDLYREIGQGPVGLQYHVDSLTDDGAGNALSGTQVSRIYGLANLGYNLIQGGASDLQNRLSGIQAAIWSIEYGPTFSFVSDRPVVNTYMSTYKALAETDTLTGYGAYALLSDDGKTQGFVIGVPEPATWAMMIIGFGAVGMMVRSRRRLALAA